MDVGVIEGFYGQPWGWAARADALPFLAARGFSFFLYAPKADGAYVAGGGELAILDVSNPHPEVSLATLFSRIWYEGYPEPAYVWQSSSATNDAEAKMSLTPLLVGTLKGTFTRCCSPSRSASSAPCTSRTSCRRD